MPVPQGESGPALQMPRTAHRYPTADERCVGANFCPVCGGQATRIRRRSIDRLMSRVVPKMRFRCLDISCGWVGNVRCPVTHCTKRF